MENISETEKREYERKARLDWIYSNVPDDDLLAQLAEEACELGQAALKLRRAQGDEWFRISPQEAYENLKEEITDVKLCLDVLGLGVSKDLYYAKLERWESRLVEQIERKEEE